MSYASSPGTKPGIHWAGISLPSQTSTTSSLNAQLVPISAMFSAVLFSSYQPLLQVLPSVSLHSVLYLLGNRRWTIPLSRQTFNCNNSCTLSAFKDSRKPDSNSSQTQPTSQLCTCPYEI